MGSTKVLYPSLPRPSEMMRWFSEKRALAAAMPPRATCSLSAVWKATSVCVGGVKRNCPVHVNVNVNVNVNATVV